ncbi:MAG: ATP-binding cassette domain-containing protein, partial [Propionibacteriaceae bacterium]
MLDTDPSSALTHKEPLIKLTGVSQVFKTKRGLVPAVDQVDMSVGPGQVLCIVGESGCGKTTTARMAAGLTKPTGGTVAYRGKDIWSMSSEEFVRFRR